MDQSNHEDQYSITKYNNLIKKVDRLHKKVQRETTYWNDRLRCWVETGPDYKRW